ncbi:CHASE2 domain-containing protein [Ovoidimarina sediminis]|uniref:CHASE2 domain-containing protein n=1 Tax=Ovoidimarina sediminis TaxID=3079856 RepID=UPI00290A3DB0|nr:adenylate/guanylate cyclase domain-containing protein [Rhodophyticola sp. MJ-SS7]MDU8944948.1 adenylate/guanylate cyclase domain-containing protein [Rhodophyticola sp. MJ-SS7]
MFRALYSRIGTARLIALGLVLFALAVRVIDPIPIQIVRNLTFDFFQRVLPREPEAFPVAILDVDDASIAEIGQWPWPRTRFAELVDKATQAGAAAIGFDIIFAEPDRLSPQLIAEDNPNLSEPVVVALSAMPSNDETLADAFRRARVVVGQTSVRSAFNRLGNEASIPPVPHAVVGPDPAPFIMKLPELVQNLPELEEAAAGRGVFSARPDPDGIYRRLPIVALVDGQMRLGLAPELLRVATGGEPFVLRTNDAGIDGVVLARNFFRTAGDGTVRPYLTVSQPSRFVPAADLLYDRMEPGRLNGHLVLVGTSAIGLGDFRATPMGVQVPGVEIHAQLMENMLSGSLLFRPNYAIAVELVAAAVICVLLIILTPIMTASFLVLSTLLFLTTCGFVSFWVFQQQRMLLDPSFPIVAGLATIMFMATANYLREEKRRREIRNAFRHYVSADLVNALTDNSEALQLGGETRELTLLFSDVRGFTAIAEGFRQNPAGLTQLMNRFLTLLSNAILEERGTIDKFMGDAVMAFWNAPLDHDDHARAACRAALKMQQSVEALNKARREEAEDGEFLALNIGIGVSSGSCMVGNMGSDTRFDYTAMGDPVNLASRLEGQSKYYGKTVIVGSATEEVAREDFAFLELDLIRVKGKTQAERVFALMGDATMRESADFAELRDANSRMLDAFRAGNWAETEAAIADLDRLNAAQGTGLETHIANYRARLAEVSHAPAPDGWDGVYDATSK